MNKIFSNQDYEILAKDVIGDTFYANNSYRDKVSKERQYAEIIVRKVLDINPSDQVVLGDKKILKKVAGLPHNSFFLKAINKIKAPGNQTTHTQYLLPVKKADFDEATDSLFDMYAYVAIKYFDKYKFGSRNDVMTAFSLLPPIIRFKALEYLFSVEPDNIAVADKLVLAVMKAENPDDADAWVKQHKEKLEALPCVSEQAYQKMVADMGEVLAKEVMLSTPKNMYELSVSKIEQLRGRIENEGTIYKTFEEALPYYKEHGIIPDDGTDEIQEFNDMMEFMYLGRKENKDQEIEEPFMVINMLD